MKVLLELDMTNEKHRALLARVAGLAPSGPVAAPAPAAPTAAPAPAPAAAGGASTAPQQANPAPRPAAPAPAAPPPNTDFIAEMRVALGEFSKYGQSKADGAMFLREQLGVPNLSAIPVEKRPEALAKINARIEELKNGNAGNNV